VLFVVLITSHISLLCNIDSLCQPPHRSLRTIASQDHLFLSHDFHQVTIGKSISSLRCLFDLTSALLHGIQCSPTSCMRTTIGADAPGLMLEDLQCRKSIANLEHLLQCLQQFALDAIVNRYLEMLESHILGWFQQRQHMIRGMDGWFNEWPNGQRPLSTTWPWNVKPSLLVLWGVCWMFYGNDNNDNRLVPPSRNFEADPNPSGHDYYSRLTNW